MSDEKGFSFNFTKQVFFRAIDEQLTVISDEVNQVTKRMIADWLFCKYFLIIPSRDCLPCSTRCGRSGARR